MKFEYDFTVGDEVRVKEFKEMAELFDSPDEDGDIYIEHDNIWFCKEMKKFCGKTYKVIGFRDYEYGDGSVVFQQEDDVPFSESTGMYTFTPSMLEPVNIKVREIADESSVSDLIFG